MGDSNPVMFLLCFCDKAATKILIWLIFNILHLQKSTFLFSCYWKSYGFRVALQPKIIHPMQNNFLHTKQVFCELFDSYSKKLYQIARRHVSASDAEDIVQELFLEIWKKRDEIEVKDSWEKYLYAVLKYRIIRFLNEKNEMEESLREALQEIGSRDEMLTFEQLYAKMEAAIELLPGARKTILQKRYFENMRIKDIAKELRISQETVREQLKRAKLLLHRELKDSLANFLF